MSRQTRLLGRTPRHGVFKLEKSGISKAVMDKLCGEYNPLHPQNEGSESEAPRGKDKLPSVDGSEEPTVNT